MSPNILFLKTLFDPTTIDKVLNSFHTSTTLVASLLQSLALLLIALRVIRTSLLLIIIILTRLRRTRRWRFWYEWHKRSTMFNWSCIDILWSTWWWINWIVILKTYAIAYIAFFFASNTMNIFLKILGKKYLKDTFQLEKNVLVYEFWKAIFIPLVSCLVQLVLFYHHILYQPNLHEWRVQQDYEKKMQLL